MNAAIVVGGDGDHVAGEHHGDDGADLRLPLRLGLAAQHARHQAGGGVAAGQPLLPILHHHGGHRRPGQYWIRSCVHSSATILPDPQ